MNTKNQNIDELKRINYELFIWMCTTLALFNTVLIFLSKDVAAVTVAIRVNLLLSVVFYWISSICGLPKGIIGLIR